MNEGLEIKAWGMDRKEGELDKRRSGTVIQSQEGPQPTLQGVLGWA